MDAIFKNKWFGLVSLILTFFLRAFVARNGAPLSLHPDEHWIFGPAFQMTSDGSWDPHWYALPPFLTTLFRVVITVFHAMNPMTLATPHEAWFDSVSILPEQFVALYVGRLMIAFFGVVTIWLIHQILILYTRRMIAMVFAGLYAVSDVIIAYSSFLRPEPLVIFFLILATYFLCHFQFTRKKHLLWLAGIAIGFSIGTKYNAGFFLLPAMLFLLTLDETDPFTCIKLAIASLLGFMIAAFQVFWKFQEISNDFFKDYRIYKRGQYGDMGSHSENFYYYIAQLNKFQLIFWLAIACIVLYPLVWNTLQKKLRPVLILCVSFCIGYLVFLCQFRYRAERNLIFIDPFLFLFVAFFFDFLIQNSKKKVRQFSIVIMFLTGALIFVKTFLLLRSASYSAPQNQIVSWIDGHLPPQSKIIREFQSPLLNPSKFQTIYIHSVSFIPPQSILSLDPTYLLLTEPIRQLNQTIPTGLMKELPPGYASHFSAWIWSKPFDFEAQNQQGVPMGVSMRVINFQNYKAEYKKIFAQDLTFTSPMN